MQKGIHVKTVVHCLESHRDPSGMRLQKLAAVTQNQYMGGLNAAKDTPDAPIRRPVPTEAPAPRWPAVVALAATAGLYAALPPGLSVGPRWLLPTVTVVLLLPTVVAHRTGRHSLNQALGLLTNGLITLGLVSSLARLVAALPAKSESPTALLLSAAALWLSNVLVFALWYWRLDAGGPRARSVPRRSGVGGGRGENRPPHAFLFPQMTLDDETRRRLLGAAAGWTPDFVDYLFVAFNTSSAFSPTDTAVLARWAKMLTMLQASVSLVTLTVLASRAVNIL